jgi:hypothetical protein
VGKNHTPFELINAEKKAEKLNFASRQMLHTALLSDDEENKGDETLVWYFDTGASQHMTCQREWLKEFTPFLLDTAYCWGRTRELQ